MYSSCYVCYLFIYRASKVQKSKNRFVRADVLFAELASDFGGELVVGGGPFREPPTVMQSTVFNSIPLYSSVRPVPSGGTSALRSTRNISQARRRVTTAQ